MNLSTRYQRLKAERKLRKLLKEAQRAEPEGVSVVAAANAASWAGRPPAPDLCWFYKNRARTRGFWDLCP
jgi:hypothetical protein